MSKDVEDGKGTGIEVIEDGIVEPVIPELKGKTGLALAHVVTSVMNPKIETVIELSTDSLDLTASIATIIGLAVA